MKSTSIQNNTNHISFPAHRNRKMTIIFGIVFSIMFTSCKKFLEIDPPKSSLVNETVFQNNDQATSAVTGMYTVMANASSYASGSGNSITCFAGLSSDELIGYNTANKPFYENQLYPELAGVRTLYSGIYQSIYTANAVLEQLVISTGVTPPVKAQLRGEALFMRAFGHFYLVNLFHKVPLLLSTDYRITQKASQASVQNLYHQVIDDLLLAETLLNDAYPTDGRVRPNKSAVQAMLARTYLYMSDWANAEKYASLVINKTNTYSMVNLDAVFLVNSKEAIWQLMPATNTNASDGTLFIPPALTAAPLVVSLSSEFALNAFEANDNRKDMWVRNYTHSTGTYYYPYKYRARLASTPATEYSVVLRLAEQFLIRAEARINQDKIDLGIADLNSIRTRARPLPTISVPNPLPPLSAMLNKAAALLAVEQERRVEMFCEWGHRWLDLKRTERANLILSPKKTQWQTTDLLYPVPQDEINRNPNIKQNDGY